MLPEDVADALTAPSVEVGARLNALVEGQWYEPKSVRVSPERLANAEVGFANAEGGAIVIGLVDGAVEGTRAEPHRVNALLQAAYDLTVPSVRHRVERVACVNDAGAEDELLVVVVEPGQVVHANHRDEVFLRVGDETRRLTFDQRRELLFDKGQAGYDAQPVPGTTLADADGELADAYADRPGHPSMPRLLVARGLADPGGALTVAGVLLFAEYPQRWFPEAYVRVLRYRGNRRATGADQNITLDTRHEGPLLSQLEAARRAVRAVVPKRRALRPTGRFGDVPLIPERAWLEGVVNAVVHRSYSNSGDHIRVEVFDDRIEVSSPGRFPGIVRLDDPLRAVRFARNPRIAHVVRDHGYGEELGEGIRRMFGEMRSAGLVEPAYQQTSGSVRLVLSAERDHRPDAAVPGESGAIVELLREAGRLSTGEVAEALRIARPTAIRKLIALREAGIVEWVGMSARDPRAYWRLPT